MPLEFEALEQRSEQFWMALGIPAVALLGAVDYLTGTELTVAFFYLIPVALVSWYSTRRLGIALAAFSAATWALADLTGGHAYSSPWILVWNGVTRLGFFLVVVFLVSALRVVLRIAQDAARADHVTGAANARFFSELLQREIDRNRRYRYPFSVAYIDLDNFKLVNDQHGHEIGNAVLRALVDIVNRDLRTTDLVARIGGDEFAILMPETGASAAHAAISKLQTGVRAAMQSNQWPVTCSIGVVTFLTPPPDTDTIFNLADAQMYCAKKAGKDDIRSAVYDR